MLEGVAIDEKFLGLTLFTLIPNTTEFMNAMSFAMNGNIALRYVSLINTTDGVVWRLVRHTLCRSAYCRFLSWLALARSGILNVWARMSILSSEHILLREDWS